MQPALRRDASGVREDGSTRYYRFRLPEASGDNGGQLPAEIELFSHAVWPVGEGIEIVPVPFDGDLSSLSAILLDEDYYGFIRQGIVSRHGVPVPDVLHIIADDARKFLSNLEGYAQVVRRKERPRVVETANFLRGIYGL